MEKLTNFFNKYLHPVMVILMHLAAVVAIYFSFLPIAKWYLESSPLWGIDFHLSLSNAALIAQNPVLPHALWNYAGFAGWPQYLYPSLSAYFISFLAQFYDLVMSAQLMVMGSSLLFILGAYFLFFSISKNVVLAVSLAIFTGFCGGVYQVLTWAGSLPSFSAQAAYPWTLGFLIMFLRTKNMRYLLASALIAGISIWVHPLVFIAYILPSFFIICAFTFSKNFPLFLKLKTFIIFLLISLAIGLPQFYLAIGPALKSPVQTDSGKNALSTARAEPSQIEIDIANFNRIQVKRLVTDNNYAIFYFLAFCALLFVLASAFAIRIGGIFEVLPFGLLAAYYIFYVWLFGEGISIYHGGWYRLFWSVPIWVGAFASALWFSAFASLKKVVKSDVLKLIFVIGSGVIVFVLYYFFYPGAQNLTISSIIYRSETSSAYPDALNLKVTNSEREELKRRLVPSWINGDETNWRLYDADQTVNIWWNNMFKMPLARGYIDTPIGDARRGFSFLLDSGLSEEGSVPQLTEAFKFPEEAAVSTTLFLIDWNAVKYFEGPHVSVVNKPLPNYLKDLLVLKNEILTFDDLRYTKRPLTLNYSEIKNEMTSPILAGTNAPTIGVFATDEGYEIVNRALSERGNLNSQVLIPINLGKKIDALDTDEISKFDALYLHDYGYDNQGKAFKMLRSFLESGKKIYIDTGTEVAETSGELPDDIFPVNKLTRQGQGKEWALESPDKYLTGDLDLSKFSPPVFDDADWSISYAQSGDVKSGARVILTNHGKPVMASLKVGNGELIWGGFNMAYHILRNHNLEEAKLFDNVLAQMVSLDRKPLPLSEVKFINPNERRITTSAKGVLFKEQAYNGWSAKVVGGEKLHIYKAGPTYPGFIYVFLPTSDKTTVEFAFLGSLRDKILVWFSLILAISIFEEAAFGGIVLGRLRKFAWSAIRCKVGKWWQKEDEGE